MQRDRSGSGSRNDCTLRKMYCCIKNWSGQTRLLRDPGFHLGSRSWKLNICTICNLSHLNLCAPQERRARRKREKCVLAIKKPRLLWDEKCFLKQKSACSGLRDSTNPVVNTYYPPLL
jgi:hypothetical protein